MNQSLRWLALLALDYPSLPEGEQIAESLARQFPEAPPLAISQSTERMLTCMLGEQIVAVTLVPHPIDPSRLEGPLATAWYWPEAADALHGHAAHLLVMLVDEGGRAIEKSLRLTQVVSAVADQAKAIGILWGPGHLIHPRGAFLEQAEQVTRDNLPLYLWVDFRISPIAPIAPINQNDQIDQTSKAAPGNNGNASNFSVYSLFTTGLEALGQSELEVARYHGQPQQMLEFVYNVAHYLLDQRKMVHDGETIGLSEEVQATIQHGPSMIDGETEVYKLDFEVAE